MYRQVWMLVAVLHLFGDVEAHYHKKYYLKALKAGTTTHYVHVRPAHPAAYGRAPGLAPPHRVVAYGPAAGYGRPYARPVVYLGHAGAYGISVRPQHARAQGRPYGTATGHLPISHRGAPGHAKDLSGSNSGYLVYLYQDYGAATPAIAAATTSGATKGAVQGAAKGAAGGVYQSLYKGATGSHVVVGTGF